MAMYSHLQSFKAIYSHFQPFTTWMIIEVFSILKRSNKLVEVLKISFEYNFWHFCGRYLTIKAASLKEGGTYQYADQNDKVHFTGMEGDKTNTHTTGGNTDGVGDI